MAAHSISSSLAIFFELVFALWTLPTWHLMLFYQPAVCSQLNNLRFCFSPILTIVKMFSLVTYAAENKASFAVKKKPPNISMRDEKEETNLS